MLHQVATLNSTMSLGDAANRLADFSDDVFVVVRRREGAERYWYRFRVADIRYHATGDGSYWADKLDAPLIEVLNLHEYTANRTVQVEEGSAEDTPGDNGILLDGETVVGVLESEPVASAIGGGGAPKGASPVPASPAETVRSPPPVAQESEFAADSGATAGATARFSAFPKLQAPDGVPFNTVFQLIVGLTREQIASATAPIVVPDASADEFVLQVQVIATGFEALAGTQKQLRVLRSDLSANHVVFELVATADEPTEPRLHTLEVQFSYQGNTCGRAWRDVTVVPATTSMNDVPVAEEGSSPLTTPGGSNAPDLTISITEGDEDGRLVWLFTSPHAVDLRDAAQIETRLDNHNARSFATKVLKGIPSKDGTGQVGMHMTGAARQIAQAMPTEFWQVLGDVWSLVHAEGRLPRLLFLSAEPYVPWELASVEDDYIDPALIDTSFPLLLNAQTGVGRWLPPRPRSPRGGERPSQPPPAKVSVSDMVVVTGDYLAINGVRPLPEAEEEGELLASKYQAIRLTATWDDIEDLLQNQVEKNDQQVDIHLMHFACHGQVDPNNPNYNGIVLNSGNMRLDPTTARGNTIGSATQPFAFMNACEVGMAGETLGSYGGLAAAFLNEGFRGFVAPLWAVNDKLAHEMALKFYEQTLDNHQPVAEALRTLRMEYDPDAPMPSSTPLAYIFYGHPDLVLEKH